MAGSSGNWYKITSGGSVKGRAYLPPSEIRTLLGLPSTAEIGAQRRELRANPALAQQLHDELREIGIDARPAGTARTKATPADSVVRKLSPAFSANVTVVARDSSGNLLSRAEQEDMFAAMGEKLGLGRPLVDRDIAGMSGALDGAEITISVRNTGSLSVRVQHPLYSAKRVVIPESDTSEAWVANNWIKVQDSAPPGTGTRIFARQVEFLAAMGVAYIQADAAGGPGDDTYNGYYTWPRLGYTSDASDDVFDRVRSKLPPSLEGAGDVLDLFALPGGAEWWRANGKAFLATFDLTPGSRSRQALQDYLDVKGIDPYLPEP